MQKMIKMRELRREEQKSLPGKIENGKPHA
jgi:hypothetical protein